METHPLNPMTDADIRRWLRRQTRGEIGWIPFETVQGGPAALRSALVAEERAGRRLVVVDAVTEDDLRSIGAALGGSLLVTGGSGLALELPGELPPRWSDFGNEGVICRTERTVRGAVRLVLECALGGGVSRKAPWLSGGSRIRLDRGSALRRRWTFVRDREARRRAGIIHSTADPLDVARVQSLFGRERVSAAMEGNFAGLAAALADDGVTRLVVGGGEEPGAVWALSV